VNSMFKSNAISPNGLRIEQRETTYDYSRLPTVHPGTPGNGCVLDVRLRVLQASDDGWRVELAANPRGMTFLSKKVVNQLREVECVPDPRDPSAKPQPVHAFSIPVWLLKRIKPQLEGAS
jgi:hypothetical protein